MMWGRWRGVTTGGLSLIYHLLKSRVGARAPASISTIKVRLELSAPLKSLANTVAANSY